MIKKKRLDSFFSVPYRTNILKAICALWNYMKLKRYSYNSDGYSGRETEMRYISYITESYPDSRQYNHCFHISHYGQFFQYINNCDLKELYGFCVDNNDNLFECALL